MRTASVRLPEHLDCRLTALAKKPRTSRAQVLRDALDVFAKRNGKLTVSDLAGDLIGSVDGLCRLLARPPHDRSVFWEQQDLKISGGSGRMGRCSMCSAPDVGRPSPVWWRG
jgi:hypothetical protein